MTWVLSCYISDGTDFNLFDSFDNTAGRNALVVWTTNIIFWSSSDQHLVLYGLWLVGFLQINMFTLPAWPWWQLWALMVRMERNNIVASNRSIRHLRISFSPLVCVRYSLWWIVAWHFQVPWVRRCRNVTSHRAWQNPWARALPLLNSPRLPRWYVFSLP